MRKDHLGAALVGAIALIALIALAAASPSSMAQDSPPPPARTDQPDVSPPANPPDAAPAVPILESHELQGILGLEVRSATGENMGRIVDVVVDRSGQVRAAVIDFGGFLGVGSRKIAVDWDALSFPRPGDKAGRVTLEFTRDQVKAGPEYQAGKTVVVLGSQGKLESFPFQ
jgi:sporulation protein YlmC with PRC-barrel domain